MKQFGLAGMALFWLVAGCGKVGDPHPPAIRVPAKIEDLTASQTETKITLTWTNPPRNIDGTKVDDLKEIQVFEGEKVIETVPAMMPGSPQSVSLDVTTQLNATRIYNLIVTTRRGKTSAPSNAAAIKIVDFPGVVSGLDGYMDQRRIFLSWKPPERNSALADVYVVRRLDGGIPPQMVSETHFTDESVEAGKTFSYTVTAGHVTTATVLGPQSLPKVVVAKDSTPPKSPTGLKVIESDSGAIIQWDANSEMDIAGYLVFRRQDPGGGFAQLNTDILKGTSFRDPQFKPGFTYEIIAEDLDGNKSEASDPSR